MLYGLKTKRKISSGKLDYPFWFFVCLFSEMDSLCSPRTHCVDQTGLELTEIHLRLPTE